MASLLATATGNFTAISSWGVVDSTSELDSEASTTIISTTNLDSSTFTPGEITVDGVAIKISGRATTPSGTFTATLRNSTDSIDIASVTINVSDLPTSALGWFFFKFSSSYTLLAATNYLIRLVCSATGNQVTVYRNATSNNHSRKLRTTTTAAPGSGDHLVICNELTGAGTSNAITITMENTATTSFGPTVSGGPPQGIVVSGFGTLTWATSGSTNYYLKWKGVFLISGGGTVNIGTSGTPIPATSTAVLEMDCVANVDSGIHVFVGGTLNAYGVAPTTRHTLMTADAAATDTIIQVSSTTGWAAGDELAFAATSATATQIEKRTISTVDSSVQVTLTSGLSFAHLGTAADVKCEVGHLTRNVKFRGLSTSLQGYLQLNGQTAVSTLVSVEISAFGSGSDPKRGIQIINGVTLTMTSCTFHDCSTGGSWALWNSSGSVSTLTISFFVVYSVNTFFTLQVNNFGSLTDSLFIGYINMSEIRCTGAETFKNNTLTSPVSGFVSILLLGPSSTSTSVTFERANWSGNVLHHCASSNILVIASALRYSGTLLNWKIWSASIGVAGIVLNTTTFFQNFIMEGLNIFGTGSVGFNFNNPCGGKVTFKDCSFSNSSVGISTGTGAGIQFIERMYLYVILDTCTFGVVTGIHTAHATSDLIFNHTGVDVTVLALNTRLASTTPHTTLSSSVCSLATSVRSQKWLQTANDHRAAFVFGRSTLDTNIYRASSPSLRLVPNNASNKFGSAIVKQLTIDSGSTPILSVWARKSSSGDATYQSITPANYNGNHPRLILKQNIPLGITADTVLATMTAAVGNWEELSATLPAPSDHGIYEVYVDCDGTAGWVNIDDWLVT